MYGLHYYSPTDGAPMRLDTAWLNLKYTSNGLRKRQNHQSSWYFNTSILKVGCCGQGVSMLESKHKGTGSRPGWGGGGGGVIVLCFWARRHVTLVMPHSNQVYKWVLANYMLRELSNAISSSRKKIYSLDSTKTEGRRQSDRNTNFPCLNRIKTKQDVCQPGQQTY